jgi:hypothetical protein
VSHQIKTPEQELGEPLFIRAKRGVKLSQKTIKPELPTPKHHQPYHSSSAYCSYKVLTPQKARSKVRPSSDAVNQIIESKLCRE